MVFHNPHQIYKQTAVQTATPERLLLMLFDGLVSFVNQAKVNLDKRNIEQVHINLTKAQAILSELMTTLNMNYEISHQLLPLYEYCYHRLVEANVKKVVEPIHEVSGLLTELRNTWEQALHLSKKAL